MRAGWINGVEAALPIKPPGVRGRYLRVNAGLDGLTVLVGPNGSGKTTILQSIGYTVSGMLNPYSMSIGFSLAKTLRPNDRVPENLLGRVSLWTEDVFTAIVTPPIFSEITGNPLGHLSRRLGIEHKVRSLIYESDRDIRRIRELSIKVSGRENRKRSFYLSHKIKYDMIVKTVSSVLGRNVDVVGVDPFMRIDSFSTSLEDKSFIEGEPGSEYGAFHDKLSEFLWFAPTGSIKILYNLYRNRLDKAVIVESGNSLVIFKTKGIRVRRAEPAVVVFHPGFAFCRGVFEGLYRYYIDRGLPREDEALSILREYIPWIKGYYPRRHDLMVKVNDGRVVSVYKLSDGHRIAVFLSFLYALHGKESVFLIDTPEAFVHPDGLRVVSDFISGLAGMGNQVVIATQSIEFLERLLRSADRRGLLGSVLIEKVELSRDGQISPVGQWRGEVGLNAISELGFDLRM